MLENQSQTCWFKIDYREHTKSNKIYNFAFKHVVFKEIKS